MPPLADSNAGGVRDEKTLVWLFMDEYLLFPEVAKPIGCNELLNAFDAWVLVPHGDDCLAADRLVSSLRVRGSGSAKASCLFENAGE
jgi:hypothetical protein